MIACALYADSALPLGLTQFLRLAEGCLSSRYILLRVADESVARARVDAHSPTQVVLFLAAKANKVYHRLMKQCRERKSRASLGTGLRDTTPPEELPRS